MKRTFTVAELAEIGVPPDSPTDIQYDPDLLADEHVATLKYSQKRRCVFCDGLQTWAVEYEAAIDAGDFEVGEQPSDHGWYGGIVEAVEVVEREVTVTRWQPVGEADGERRSLSRFTATPSEIDDHLGHVLAEDTYLRYQQAVGGRAVSEAAKDLRMEVASREADPAWLDAADHVDPLKGGGYFPAELVEFAPVAAARAEAVDRHTADGCDI